ncbi:MAG TPA: Rv3654c family TadE-like protein [Nocardioidaceae bacterium]|nr:Rv3654c family TadE-like protein [Nocardioidaceae bacterium]
MTRDSERGSATVYAVFFVGLLTTVGIVAAAVASLFVGHRQVAAAADLAALAGASALQQQGSACAAAGGIARRNGTTLVSCQVRGDVVSIRVATQVPSLFRTSIELRARARAGPVAGAVP